MQGKGELVRNDILGYWSVGRSLLEEYLVDFVVNGSQFASVLAQKVSDFVSLGVVVRGIYAKIWEYFILMRFDSDFAIAKNNIKLVIGNSFPVGGGQKVNLFKGDVNQKPISRRMSFGYETIFCESCDELGWQFDDKDQIGKVVDVFMEIYFVEEVQFIDEFCSDNFLF